MFRFKQIRQAAMLLCVSALPVLTPQMHAATYRTSSVTELKTYLTKTLQVGDTLIVSDGSYNLGGVKLTCSGTPEQPIVIQTEHLLGAKLTAKTYLTIQDASYIEIRGFDFDLDPVSTIIKLQGASHIRITRNHFRMQTASETQTSKWILIGDLWDDTISRSHHNRIDHCLFEDKLDGGPWVVIDGAHGKPDISKYDLIDHNIFRNNSPRADNEKETIRMGVSDLVPCTAGTTVEYNLFEDCDGDPEIVSVKSCGNTIRYNTFLHSLGTLCLRQGHHNTVYGNYFLGQGKTGTSADGSDIGCGGIRVYGSDHVIHSNYMQGLTGSKWDAAITITNGDAANTSTSYSKHFLPENLLIAHNTLINNTSEIEIGFTNNGKYSKKPKNCLIADNIVVDTMNAVVTLHTDIGASNIRWMGNIFHLSGTATDGIASVKTAEVRHIDPKLILTNRRTPEDPTRLIESQLYKLSSSSPAIDGGDLDSITTDMEGQRAIDARDIGADEYNPNEVITASVMSEQTAGINAPEEVTLERIQPAAGLPETPLPIGCTANPFHRQTNLTVLSDRRQAATISLVDISGHVLERRHVQLDNGLNVFRITAAVKGIIVACISFGQQTHSIKLTSK